MNGILQVMRSRAVDTPPRAARPPAANPSTAIPACARPAARAFPRPTFPVETRRTRARPAPGDDAQPNSAARRARFANIQGDSSMDRATDDSPLPGVRRRTSPDDGGLPSTAWNEPFLRSPVVRAGHAMRRSPRASPARWRFTRPERAIRRFRSPRGLHRGARPSEPSRAWAGSATFTRPPMRAAPRKGGKRQDATPRAVAVILVVQTNARRDEPPPHAPSFLVGVRPKQAPHRERSDGRRHAARRRRRADPRTTMARARVRRTGRTGTLLRSRAPPSGKEARKRIVSPGRPAEATLSRCSSRARTNERTEIMRASRSAPI